MKSTATPIPARKVFTVVTVVLGTGVNLAVIFPFAAWMVSDFLPDSDFKTSDGDFDDLAKQKAVAIKSGWLVSQFMLGQACSAFAWGYLADRLVCVCVCVCVCVFVCVVCYLVFHCVVCGAGVAVYARSGVLCIRMGIFG